MIMIATRGSCWSVWRRRCRGVAVVLVLVGGLTAEGQDAERRDRPSVRMDREVALATIDEQWEPLFVGIDRLDLRAEEPRLMRGAALRIDLQAPGLAFLVAPSNGDRPKECDSITTSNFLAAHALQAAINAAPFAPVVGEEGIPQDVIGLAISRGELVSEPEPGYGAILISTENRVEIVEQPPETIEGVENACGGFRRILVEGEIVIEDESLHPRSAAGVSQDGRYFYWLVIDGRQPGFSLGATQVEVAEWLQALGSWTGLNLDGGGSSSLVIAGPEGSPLNLNQPIHAGHRGRERPCPNHLGVFALPIETTNEAEHQP